MHVSTEASICGHVFSVMLACKIERQLAGCRKHLDCPVSEDIDEPGAIYSIIVTLKQASFKKTPKPSRST